MSELETTCERLSIDLESYLDHGLDRAAVKALEAHLETCPACAAELEVAERLSAELRSLPRLRAPDAAVEALLARARAESSQASRPPTTWWSRPWLQPAALALAAALVLALGAALLWAPRSEPDRTAGDPAVAVATLETKLALAHFAKASRRVGREVGGDQLQGRLIRPMVRSVSTSLERRAGTTKSSAGSAAPERG